MKKKPSLISKPDVMSCWRCEGKREITNPNMSPRTCCKMICPTCDGSGTWIENHYIVIDEKNKIAIDSDTGG